MIEDRNKGISQITYNHLNLPVRVEKNTGEYITYHYDATGAKLSQEVYDANDVLQKRSDYVGEFFYENDTLRFVNHEEGRVVLNKQLTPEYQYMLKDHLGNVRVTFTSKTNVQTYSATMETSTQTQEQADFGNYKSTVNDMLDHTDAGTTYTRALVLNGGYNGQVGLAKSFAVMPGDVISAKDYAKYMGSPGQASALGSFAAALTGAFGLTPPGIIDGPSAYSAINDIGGILATGNHPGDDDADPKGFLNVLVFDKDFNLVDFAFDQLDGDYEQTGAIKIPHDLLETNITIRQQGYVYVFLSNEEPNELQIGFDDYEVSHQESGVVQMEDYYPFGSTFNSYSRENATENKYLYNQGTGEKTFKTERITDLGLNVDMSRDRVYDYITGRWWQVDPKADKEGQESWSTYQYGFDNPIRYNDPYGDCPTCWQSFVAVATATYAKYSNILSPAVAPTQRLVSGNSGSTPSGIGMDSQTRSIVKVTGTAQDVNTVVETGKNASKEVVKDVGEVADKGGEAVSDLGYALAIPTEGATLPLAFAGEVISASGKGLKATVSYAEGDTRSGNVEAGKILFGATTNALTGAAIKKSVEVGNITNATENATNNTVLNGLSSVINKIVDFFSDEKK